MALNLVRRTLVSEEDVSMIRTTALGILATLAATPAFANFNQVPEIDALSGIAALAVVGAAVALVRERSK